MSLFHIGRQSADHPFSIRGSAPAALLNEQGCILEANDALLAASGFEASGLRGRLMFGESCFASNEVYEDVRRQLREGGITAASIHFPTRGGGTLHLQAVFVPTPVGSGKETAGWLMACSDLGPSPAEKSLLKAESEAIKRAMAVVHLDPEGKILDANDHFLTLTGYHPDEIRGQRHSMFLSSEAEAASSFSDMWSKLRRGEVVSSEFHRTGKNGKDMWFRASFVPVMGAEGRTERVIKFAMDVTAEKTASLEAGAKIAALDKVQAVIEFTPEGFIIDANDVFLGAMGYRREEIRGKHHRMFVEPVEAATPAYALFWKKLGRGEFENRIYRRIRKGGAEVFIQASYNPIRDLSGKVYKIVKYASDVTSLMGTGKLAENAMSDVQSVAAAIEQMTASVNEISQNMKLSTAAASEIHLNTGRSAEVSERLSRTMRSMEDITDMINRVAGQVNLLALNATIEAARAGEAGKGFAVVATEVKNLALQTTAATEDISKQIQEAQHVAAGMLESIRLIGANATDVNRFITGAAGAVEEQSAVSREISANTQRVSGLVTEIADRIRRLTAVA